MAREFAKRGHDLGGGINPRLKFGPFRRRYRYCTAFKHFGFCAVNRLPANEIAERRARMTGGCFEQHPLIRADPDTQDSGGCGTRHDITSQWMYDNSIHNRDMQSPLARW